MKLKDKIRILRKSRGFSQQDLGDRMSKETYGLTRQSICDWENGRSEPKLENIRSLAEVLNVSYDVLLDESLDLNDDKALQDILNGNYGNKSGHSPTNTFRFSRDFILLKVLLIAACFVALIFIIKNGIESLNSIKFDEITSDGTLMGKLDANGEAIKATQKEVLEIIKSFIYIILATIVMFIGVVFVLLIPSKYEVGQIDDKCISFKLSKRSYIPLYDIENVTYKGKFIFKTLIVERKNGELIKVHLLKQADDVVRTFKEFNSK